MLYSIARNWWLLLIRGIFAVLFGLVAFIWPAITLYALVVLYGAYALMDGIAAVIFGIGARVDKSADAPAPRGWWGMVLVGVLGIAAGILTFLWPGITAVALLIVIAVTAIVRGAAEIAAAIRLRKYIEHEWLLGLAGALSIVFGVVLIARPQIGALAVIWTIGAWAMVFGIMAIVLSLRLRAAKMRLEGGGTRPVTAPSL
jgi:uncharacterized membrane protein HdeD (DUF308 family)